MAGFFGELKRRNVVRVGIAYVVAAWLVIQVAETLYSGSRCIVRALSRVESRGCK